MDRYDEKKNVNDSDDISNPSGDVLGLGGSTVPKMPGDPSASNDPDSVRRRRERALSSDNDAGVPSDSADKHGATGIDMGAGGHGTDISGK
jgi:hypothetical protein